MPRYVFRRRSTASRIVAAAALLILSSGLSGCSLSPLARHAAAFSDATGLVVDNSKDAYRAAMRLRQREQVAAAVYAYDTPGWSPYVDVKPLLTPEQLQARVLVLDGLKMYSATLVELTGNRHAPGLDDAAAGVGSGLSALSASLNTSFPGVPALTDGQANAASTAALALGRYLDERKIKGALPAVTKQMNDSVATLCRLLDSDIKIIRRQADVDYQSLITSQDSFIRHAGPELPPLQRRQQIGELVELASQQKSNDVLLASLQKALYTLELTHQALAAAAQGNDPESLRQKIAELTAAGQDLGAYYKSLAAPTTTATASAN